MSKKILSTLLALMMIISVAPLTAFAASTVVNNSYVTVVTANNTYSFGAQKLEVSIFYNGQLKETK